MCQFVQRYISTIGVDFGVKPTQIGGKDVRVNFWDLSGHPDFFEVLCTAVCGCKRVCVVVTPFSPR